MNKQEMEATLANVECGQFSFHVEMEGDRTVLVASYPAEDISNGRIEMQRTRKWFLSPHMTKSELVQTAFKCILTSMEHQARELFTWKGRRVYGPHFDVDALWEICRDKNLDYRRGETCKND